MLVLLPTGQVDRGCLLDAKEVRPKGPLVVCPREDHRVIDRRVDDLAKMLDHNRMEGTRSSRFPLLSSWRVIAVASSKDTSSHRNDNGSDTRQPVM